MKVMARRKAQIALPFILLVSGIIIEIVVAGSLTSYFASGSGFSERLQARASSVAYSGINDALAQIGKNKDFGALDPSYGISIEGDTATVTFQSSLSNGYYTYTITSLGVAGTRQAKVVAVAVVNDSTGHVQLQSLNEVAVQ